MKIRLLLRDLRTSRELSQEELARALNLSRQSIISLERGEYLPSSPVLLAMMEFFNCSIHDLVDGINVRMIRLIPGDEADNTETFLPLTAADDDGPEPTTALGSWQPGYAAAAGAMNVREDATSYQIEIQALGYSEKDLTLELTNNTLVVTGHKKAVSDATGLIHSEWQNSEFSRSINFTTPIDDSHVEAKLENGLLTVVAPKAQPPQPKTKRIIVKKK
ncbi:MAG TPA: Hsp20 family protein [Candidatus Saccharimonadales bacterium]|nr:Hsp20 family protein [Candidatus Saccharimonadales bacterium]